MSEIEKDVLEGIRSASNDDLKIIAKELANENKKRINQLRVDNTKKINLLALEAGLLVDIKTNEHYQPGSFGGVIEEGKLHKEKAEPKYRDPDNYNNTWSGRGGAKPKWLKEKLEQGRPLDDFLIKNE